MRLATPLVLVLLVPLAPVLSFALEFGLHGTTAYSSNAVLSDPNGLGVYLQQDLSRKVWLRGTFTWLGSEFQYRGVYPVVFPPPDYVPVDEPLRRESSARLLDLNLLHRLVDSERLSVAAGAGLGVSHLNSRLTRLTAGSDGYWDSDQLYYALLVDVRVKQIASLPIGLRLSYYFRQLSGEPTPTDHVTPFASAFTLSSLQAALAYRF